MVINNHNTLLLLDYDWWLYKTTDNHINRNDRVTGGIIKIFQTINNTISRFMLKILIKRIKKENRRLVEKATEESKSSWNKI